MPSTAAAVLAPHRGTPTAGSVRPSATVPHARRAPAGPPAPTVTVLVPAHDEGARILATLAGLREQTLRPDRVLVVADNCSDDTATLARAAGAEVYETVGNRDKKAGALNQAWALRFRRAAVGDRRGTDRRGFDRRTSALPLDAPDRRSGGRRQQARRGVIARRRYTGPVRPDRSDDSLVVVQDADSTLDRGFLAGAARHIRRDERMGAVGGTFRGDPGGGLVGHLQRNEYARYARDVRRLKGKCLVVTGTAAMFRAGTLRRISEARQNGELPAATAPAASTTPPCSPRTTS